MITSVLSAAKRLAGLNFANVASNEAALFINGVNYTSWDSLSVTRGLDSLAHNFSFSYVDKWRQEDGKWPINVGEKVEITLGTIPVMTGYIDSLDSNFSSDSRTISISGRSTTADLIDCSYLGANKISTTTYLALATKLCNPFGIKVKYQATPTNEPFDFHYEQGESVFEALHRYAQSRGYLLTTDAQGNLVVFNKDYFASIERSKTDLIQGKNILDITAKFDHSDRFSEYTLKSQPKGDDITAVIAANMSKATAKDSGVSRFRPKLILSDNYVFKLLAQKQVEWEADIRARQSNDVSVKVQGWTKADGTIWKQGDLVYLSAPAVGLSSDMIITDVTYSKSSSEGTTTSLNLTSPDSYKPSPVKEDDKPSGWDSDQKKLKKKLGAKFKSIADVKL